jgi:thioredoxin 1
MARTFTDANFSDEVLKSDVPVLVDFWAPWCAPCKIIGPVVEEIAAEMDGKGAKVGKLNVDENPTTQEMFRIMSIPTLLVIKGGNVVEQIVGVQPKARLVELLAKHK